MTSTFVLVCTIATLIIALIALRYERRQASNRFAEVWERAEKLSRALDEAYRLIDTLDAEVTEMMGLEIERYERENLKAELQGLRIERTMQVLKILDEGTPNWAAWVAELEELAPHVSNLERIMAQDRARWESAGQMCQREEQARKILKMVFGMDCKNIARAIAEQQFDLVSIELRREVIPALLQAA